MTDQQPGPKTPDASAAFQAGVAVVALRAIGPQGFAPAGAGALAAHGLLQRRTEDVDLFSPTPGGAGQVSAVLQATLTAAGYTVTVVESADQHQGEFARLMVTRNDHDVQVDVARDWRQHPPVHLQVGPVLHVDDAVGSKVTAMIGRGLPRDYLDIAAALGRYNRQQLLRLAFIRDPGLRVLDVALAMQLLDRLPDAPFSDYGLTVNQVAQARHAFQHWPRHADQDLPGQQVHDQTHRA